MKLIYSSDAIEDLTRLREFIERVNPAAARRVAVELIERIDQLRQFPEMGRVLDAPQPLNNKIIRDFSFGKYIVRYMCSSEAVIILRVWHHYENRE